MANIDKIRVAQEGQVTPGRDVLAPIGARPGDDLTVELTPGGRAELRAAAKTGIEAFFGSIEYDGPAVSLEEIRQAIQHCWSGKR
jgi:hypothetical protein